jgi:hypothetical protein
MAMTSQPAVAGKSLIDCQEDLEDSAEVCRSDNQKWSYAIPLEVIYMTPLSKWNPYNIQYNTHEIIDQFPIRYKLISPCLAISWIQLKPCFS